MFTYVNNMLVYRSQLYVNLPELHLDLFRGETLKQKTSYAWAAGKWVHLSLRVSKSAGGWKIEGKAWTDGSDEPTTWNITTEDSEELPPGRAGIFGSPFSGTPIRYDDLSVRRIADK